MHRPRSKSALFRFRFAALLLCVNVILVPAVICLIVYSLAVQSRHLSLIALELFGVIILLTIVQWIVADKTRCPLCLTPVLARKDCARHRNARSFLGNYRLRVALAILLRNSFRCPFCNEPTEMQVRERKVTRSYTKG